MQWYSMRVYLMAQRNLYGSGDRVRRRTIFANSESKLAPINVPDRKPQFVKFTRREKLSIRITRKQGFRDVYRKIL